ncbi:hypothetical protein FQN54_007319 [Arachnomyces sp. PD_36]|nr:hypothetical protein FQN54_007319 [Arachnomyces sp. PD_36]
MPPPSRLLNLLSQNVTSPSSSLTQRLSHRIITPISTRPTTIRSFSTNFRFPRPKLRLSHPQLSPPSPVHNFSRRLNSSKSKPDPHHSTSSSSSNPGSLSQRLRKLSREYGWAALGIYLFLSALDFPFCFAAVRLLGVDRIGHYEHVVVEGAKGIFAAVWPFQDHATDPADLAADADVPALDTEEQASTYDHGVAEAEKRKSVEGASIWTQLALAYAIHKSFIFIRVPLTAAVTPKVVRVLRRWGWDIGKRKPKSS